MRLHTSGVGSGVLSSFQRIGASFGATILGSVLDSAYQQHLHLTGVPATAARAAAQSVFAGESVAGQLHLPAVLAAVRGAFVNGMNAAVAVSAGVAVAGLLLGVLLLPGRTTPAPGLEPARRTALAPGLEAELAESEAVDALD